MPGEAEEVVETLPTLMDAPPAGDPPAGDPPANDPPAGDPPAGDPPAQTDEEKAAAEEERRAALTDDERAEEDRRAALTDEEREAEDAKAKADEGAPEEYADFVVPDGIELDTEALDAFKPIAKELNLTQDQAQKLVDIQAATAQRWAEGVQQHVVDTRLAWRDAAQKDKEIGGEKFAENLAIAKAGRDVFGDDPELKEVLDAYGLGDHPAVIRYFYKVGKANSEHDFVTSGKPEKSRSFYDHPTSQK